MKGIKTILGALAAASLLFSLNANAQENANRDENGKVVRGAYETNKAFDNIWIGVGAGINSVAPSARTPKTWGNIGLATDINVGKWFTPAIGLRAGWHGFWNNTKLGLTAQGVKAGQSFGFNYIHGDVMWNMINSFAGYKETRFWNIAPYATMGVLDVSNNRNPFAKGAKNNLEYAAGAGLYNTFRLSNRVNITLDLMALVGRAAAYTNNAGRLIIFPSATAGLAFNLGKTNFDRHTSITPVVVPVPFTTDQYNALKNQVAALERENAELKNKIASLESELAPFKNLVDGQTYLFQNGRFTAVEAKVASPATVYFDLGSAKLSQREQAHLEYFAGNVVNGDTQLVLTGSADKQTGTARGNQKLSEQRVETVKNLLVNKFGASASNIETVANGDTKNVFDTPAKNRCVVIEVK